MHLALVEITDMHSMLRNVPVLASRASVVLTATALLGSEALAGNVLRVGSGQPFTQIGPAVTAAASGDLILVTPGTYAPFTVNNKSVSILGDGGPFVLTPTANSPEITVTNIALGGSVTIRDAQIDYDDAGAPAVLVSGNAGSVRFSKLKVEPVAHLVFGTTAQAMVEVEDTATFWLIDSSIWWSGTDPETGDPIDWVAYTLNPRCAGSPSVCNDGVSGLQLLDSHGVVQNSRVRGLSSVDANFGGDGLRLVDVGEDLTDASAWLLEDNVSPAFGAQFRGGNGRYAGHAVHQIRSPFQADLIEACGGADAAVSLSYSPGARTHVPGTLGGLYGRNNSNGAIGGGGGVAFALVDHCPDAQRNESSVASPTVSIGTQFDVRVRSRLARRFVTYFASNSSYVLNPTPFTGRSMADGTALLGTISGTTAAMTTTTVGVLIPNTPALIGMQITVQTAFGPIGGSLNNLGQPSLAIMLP